MSSQHHPQPAGTIASPPGTTGHTHTHRERERERERGHSWAKWRCRSRLFGPPRFIGLLICVFLGSAISQPTPTQAQTKTLSIEWINFTDETFTTIATWGHGLSLANGAEFNAGRFLGAQQQRMALGGWFNLVKSSAYPLIAMYVNGQPTGFGAYVDGMGAGGSNANNVFRLDWNPQTARFTLLLLNVNYYQPGMGNPNGVNGKVLTMAVNPISLDLYMGGDFTQAGGFPYSSKIGVYRWNGGWQTQYIWSAFNRGSVMTWESSTVLRVQDGDLNSVYGPLSSFGQSSSLQTPNKVAYWNTYNGYFLGGYWTAQ